MSNQGWKLEYGSWYGPENEEIDYIPGDSKLVVRHDTVDGGNYGSIYTTSVWIPVDVLREILENGN